MNESTTPLLEVRNVVKKFGAVAALSGANFTLRPGEIVALLGDNGAGKSTLIKCLTGVYRFDEGDYVLDGEHVSPRSPAEAQALGIGTVYQDLAIFDNLTVTENFYAGRELSRPRWAGILGLVQHRQMERETRSAIDELQVNIGSLDDEVGLMSGGQRQGIAVARAAAMSERIIILDEPTAALGVRESANVVRIIKQLRKRGLAVILISHNLDEVVELADRAVVFRHGRNVADLPATEENRELIVSYLVGAHVSNGTDD